MMRNDDNFTCLHCQKLVSASAVGTAHRNHCPFCLWSKHVDDKISGDRAAKCDGAMRPVGLTFKHEGVDKYGKPRQGELMVVHVCEKCGKVSINRLAGDDKANVVLKLVDSAGLLSEVVEKVKKEGIDLLTKVDEPTVHKQLFGGRKVS